MEVFPWCCMQRALEIRVGGMFAPKAMAGIQTSWRTRCGESSKFGVLKVGPPALHARAWPLVSVKAAPQPESLEKSELIP